MGLLLSFSALGQMAELGSEELKQNQTDQEVIDWLKDLYEHGVEMKNDTFYINQESTALISDANLRSIVYPKVYTWPGTVRLIEQRHIKKALWYLINLYRNSPTNKSMVVKSILTYDKILKMDKVLISTFYTYCYMDPEIGNIKDGKPVIVAPHILEEKLRAVQEIIFHVEQYKAKKP